MSSSFNLMGVSVHMCDWGYFVLHGTLNDNKEKEKVKETRNRAFRM